MAELPSWFCCIWLMSRRPGVRGAMVKKTNASVQSESPGGTEGRGTKLFYLSINFPGTSQFPPQGWRPGGFRKEETKS